MPARELLSWNAYFSGADPAGETRLPLGTIAAVILLARVESLPLSSNKYRVLLF